MTSVDIRRLERAIRKVALLIRHSGDAYWPILERLEAERDALMSRQDRLAAYLAPPDPANDRFEGAAASAPNAAGRPAAASPAKPAKARWV